MWYRAWLALDLGYSNFNDMLIKFLLPLRLCYNFYLAFSPWHKEISTRPKS